MTTPRKGDPTPKKKTGHKTKGKRKRGKGMLGVREAATLQKMSAALDFRLQGHTFEEIGQSLEVSTTRAYELVELALKDTLAEKAEKVRQMELRRLDLMTPNLLNAAVEGDARAVDAVIKIMDRRAKLMGLDLPTKNEITGKDGKPIEATITNARDIIYSKLALIAARNGKTGDTPKFE